MDSHPRKSRAREALRHALLGLLSERPYEAITVRDICRHCGVSRSSFYVHFRDKDDLLLSGFENIGVNSYDDLFEETDRDPNYPDFAIVLFRGSEQEKEASRALLRPGADNAAYFHMRNMLVIKTRHWLRTMAPTLPEAELEPTVHYLASALQGLLTWWVCNDFPYPADTVSNHFNRLAISGLEELLHLEPADDSKPFRRGQDS